MHIEFITWISQDMSYIMINTIPGNRHARCSLKCWINARMCHTKSVLGLIKLHIFKLMPGSHSIRRWDFAVFMRIGSDFYDLLSKESLLLALSNVQLEANFCLQDYSDWLFIVEIWNIQWQGSIALGGIVDNKFPSEPCCKWSMKFNLHNRCESHVWK